MSKTELPKCVLCGFEEGHNEWCDRNPAKGQPIEYQCARVACAIPVPRGFGQCVDGTDGTRVGTNVASVEEWRQFFVTFLSQGVLPLATEQPEGSVPIGSAWSDMDGVVFVTSVGDRVEYRSERGNRVGSVPLDRWPGTFHLVNSGIKQALGDTTDLEKRIVALIGDYENTPSLAQHIIAEVRRG